MISKSKSTYIKALGILFVIISHVFNYGILTYLGALGVTLFLFISGYGLTKSYQENGLEDYFYKRFRGVFIPYFIITIIKIILCYFFNKTYSFKVILLSLIGFDLKRNIDPTMWYISFIFLWYLAFYIVFKYVSKNKNKVVLLFSISIIFLFSILFRNVIGSALGQFSLNFAVFPIGVAFAMHENKISKFIKDKYIIITLLVTTISYSTLFYLSNWKINMIFHMIFNLLMLYILIGTIILNDFKNKLIDLIGKYSYELYLVEGYFIFNLDIFETINNIYLSIIAYILLLVISTIIIKNIIKLSGKCLYNKNKIEIEINK